MRIPFNGNYVITQKFGVGKGYCKQCRPDGTHNGLDWGCPQGTPIISAEDGLVVRADMDSTGYGKHVRVRNSKGGGCIYGHFSEIRVTAGQQVKEGDILGMSGNTGNSTGAHLHFEVRTNLDICSTCIDPLKVLDSAKPDSISEKPDSVSDSVSDSISNRVNWSPLNVRMLPTLNGKVVGQVYKGYELTFSGSPVEADGYTWQPILVYVAKEGLG